MKRHMKNERRPAGFTLIELLVVVLIVGVLAATAVPQYFKLVEKSKIAEAIHLLDAIRGAQDRYQSKYGAYCTGVLTSCPGFDLNVPTMKYFNTPTTFQPGAAPPSWKATLTRNSNTAVYGSYIVTLDVEPNASAKMTCSQTNCSGELMPQ
jgi:prepilin-type N-terminal cleavage/methylation domain-containing protein